MNPGLSGGIPASLRYDCGQIDSMKSRRSYGRFWSTSSGTFSPTNNIIRIPVSSDCAFIDTNSATCHLTLNNTGAAAFVLDGGIECLFERVRVMSQAGGNLLESCDSFNLLSVTMNQVFGSAEAARSSSIMCGSAQILAGPVSNCYEATSCATLTNGVSRTYQMPLNKIGIFNPAGSKMLPVGAGVIVELTLSTAARCLVAAAPDYTVTDVYIEAPLVVVEDAAFQTRLGALALSNNEKLRWSAPTWKSYLGTAVNGGSQTIQLGDRSRSIRAIISIMRDSAALGLAAQYGLQRKTLTYLSGGSWYYDIGGRTMPPQAITVTIGVAGTTSDAAQTYGHLMQIASAVGLGSGVITRNNFCGPINIVADEVLFSPCGIIGVAIESYQDSGLMSGADSSTSGSPVSLRLNLGAAAAAITLEVQSYVLCDVEFEMDIRTGVITAFS